MSLPIIVVHKGNQKYLKRILDFSIKSGNTVVLLGNSVNKSFPGWFDASSLESSTYKSFKQVYKHYSTNTPEFELVCFERYFLTYNYMLKNNIDKCIMMDSDVILYKKVPEDMFKDYDFACGIPEQGEYDWIGAPNFAYWTINALKSFLDYCMDMYTNHLDKIEEKWNWHQTNNIGGGICDMSLLYLFTKSTTLKYCNTDDILTNIIDTKFGLTKQGSITCKMNDRFVTKKIVEKDNEIYFEDTSNNLYPVLCIHAQGKYKKHIRSLVKRHFSDASFSMDEKIWSIYLFNQKIKRKMQRII